MTIDPGGRDQLAIEEERILYQLRTYGWSPLPSLSASQVAEVIAHLRRSRTYAGYHVRYKAGPAGTWEQFAGEECVCHHHEDVLAAPHLLELALSLTDVI